MKKAILRFSTFQMSPKLRKSTQKYVKYTKPQKIPKNMAPALMEKIAVVASFAGQDRKSLYGISQKFRLQTAQKRPENWR